MKVAFVTRRSQLKFTPPWGVAALNTMTQHTALPDADRPDGAHHELNTGQFSRLKLATGMPNKFDATVAVSAQSNSHVHSHFKGASNIYQQAVHMGACFL